MIKLYLITGFLGAGKTTLLKNWIALRADRRLHVVVNEFGQTGVDGELLRGIGCALAEINNGSIFCTCRLDQFEDALAQAQRLAPDEIIVEASGLSDPGSIERIIDQPRFSGIRYIGSLCVVDAPRFEKVFSTARVTRRQLAVCRTVVVNKTDLADAEQLRRVRELIASFSPAASVYETQFGKLDPAWLDEMESPRPLLPDPPMRMHELGLQKRQMTLSGGISLFQLRKLLSMLIEEAWRIKGFVRVCDDERLQFVDCVGEQLSVTPYTEKVAVPGVLVLLAGPGMPLNKAIAQAKDWYGEYILSVE